MGTLISGPEYSTQMAEVRKDFPEAVVLLLLLQATPRVQEDIYSKA